MAFTGMAVLDQNQWFQVTIPLFDKKSLAGLRPSGSNHRAAVFFATTNTSSPAQRWQVFPAQNSTYILRSEASQGGSYLSVFANTTREVEFGGTRAMTGKPESLGEEAYWRILPVGNGWCTLKNVANGSDWNLFAKDAGMVAMTSNIQGQQDNQMFNFTRLGKIDDTAFSTIQTPSQTPTSLPGDGGSPSNTPSSSGGLSPGASIGIGVGVGGAVLIALIAGVVLLLRRRRRRSHKLDEDGLTSENAYNQYQDPVKYGYQYPNAIQASHLVPPGAAGLSVPQELAAGSAIVEADASREFQVVELGGGPASPVELAAEPSRAEGRAP